MPHSPCRSWPQLDASTIRTDRQSASPSSPCNCNPIASLELGSVLANSQRPCVTAALNGMPTLLIQTNVPGNGVDNSDILKACSRAVAQTVGKPEQWVMVSLTTDKPMCYSGTEAPCAYGELVSIGAIGGEKNKMISAAIADVLKTKLKIDPARFYLKFVDVARSDFGWNGSTF